MRVYNMQYMEVCEASLMRGNIHGARGFLGRGFKVCGIRVWVSVSL